MIRLSMAVAAIAMLSACSTSVPNDVSPTASAQRSQEYQQRRAVLLGRAPAEPRAVRVEASEIPLGEASPYSARPAPVMVAEASPAPTTVPQRARPAATPRQDRSDAGFLGMVRRAIGGAEDPAPARTAAAAPTVTALPPMAEDATLTPSGSSNPSISDEQEFEAVAARETIESDAERRAEMQAQRVEIAPTALPDRPADLGPNIISYAVSTRHAVGQQRYRRSPLGQVRHAANCRAFRSADLAQEWFLDNGGPERDRRALDPDGDGFACDWNPEPYRAAARAARG